MAQEQSPIQYRECFGEYVNPKAHCDECEQRFACYDKRWNRKKSCHPQDPFVKRVAEENNNDER